MINVWGYSYTEILPMMEFLRFLGSHFTKNSSERKLSCTSQTGTARKIMKTTNKLWNWFIKSSIPGAFLPVIENFRSQFFLTQLTAPQSARMSFSIDVGDKPGIEFLSFFAS